MLEPLPYRYLARPRVDAGEPHPEGINCRSLLQDWFLDRHDTFIPRDRIEQPGLWCQPVVPLHGATLADLAGLPDETIVLAERTRSASGMPLDRSPRAFGTLEDYRLHLHTALLLQHPDADLCAFVPAGQPVSAAAPAILHATAVAGCSCLWSLDTFIEHYRPVAARRLTP